VVPTPPAGRFGAADVEAGRLLFARSCGVCHGAEAISAGVIPDLRYSGMLERQPFLAIVRDGALKGAGMASFTGTLSLREMELVRAYLVTRQRETTGQP
jgi:mono/diheme cytochrome c family protein